jgi:hypothetical protein
MQQAMLTDALGYIAAGLVFATFCAQQMALLRALAIASNVAFIGYGFLDGLWPILILPSAMLPINIQRYRQLVREHRGTMTADARTPVPRRSTLLRDLITIALGCFRSWGERVVPAQTSFTVRGGPLRRGKKVTFRPRAPARLRVPCKRGVRLTARKTGGLGPVYIEGATRRHGRNHAFRSCVPRRVFCDD